MTTPPDEEENGAQNEPSRQPKAPGKIVGGTWTEAESISGGSTSNLTGIWVEIQTALEIDFALTWVHRPARVGQRAEAWRERGTAS